MTIDITSKLDKETLLWLCAAAAAGSLCNRRNWCHPEDLKLADGVTADPKAGTLDLRRVCWHFISAFSFLFLGMICLGGGISTFFVLIGLWLGSFFGPDFLWEIVMKMRDALMPVITGFIGKWLGSK